MLSTGAYTPLDEDAGTPSRAMCSNDRRRIPDLREEVHVRRLRSGRRAP